MNEFLALAERCEAATGADRGIDGDIAVAIGIVPSWVTKRAARQPELFMDNGPGLRARTWMAPKLTASLDEAMTLMPEGWLVISISEIKGDGMPMCVLGRPKDAALVEAVAQGGMPLALTAACLRARARDSGRHSQSRDPLGARAEGCQSGGPKRPHRPNPPSTHPKEHP